MDFREADRRFPELKRQLDAGTISPEEFDAQLRQLMVRDDEGRWWAKSRKTGEWNYHDGSAWVRDTPPVYQPPPTLSAQSTPDRQWQVEQGEGLPLSQTDLDSAPIQDQNGEKRRRGVLRWVALVAGGIMVTAALAGIGIVVILGGSGSEPSYDLVKDESGALSVEVPSEWDERAAVDSEGERGRASWSSFLGESVGPSLTVVNDLYSWRNGTVGHKGVYMVASKRLAQEHTDDELVALGPNDYSASCQAGTPQDFDQPPYSGKILKWENCTGDSEHTATTLAVAPEGRECVVVGQIGGYFRTPTDEENIQHVLDTVRADCSKVD